jgi:hypothetical protein
MAVAIRLLLTVMVGNHSVLAQSAPPPVYDCAETIKDAQVLKREQRMSIERAVEHTEELVVFTFPNGRLIANFGPPVQMPSGFPSHLLPPLSIPIERSRKIEGVLPDNMDMPLLARLATSLMRYPSCAGILE